MAIITISTLVSYTPQRWVDGQEYTIEQFFKKFYIEQVGYLANRWVEDAIENAHSFDEKQDVIAHGLYQLKEMSQMLSANLHKTISFEPTPEKEIEICFSFVYVEPSAHVSSYPSPQAYVMDTFILSMKEMVEAMIEKSASENKAIIYQVYTYFNKLLDQMSQSLLIEAS